MNIELLPLADYAAGTHTSAEFDVPDDATGYLLKLWRCTDDAPDVWPDPQQALRVQVEVYANGEWIERDAPQKLEGWSPWGAFGAYGGKHIKRGESVPQECSWLKGGLNMPLTGRRLRASLITEASVCTRMTIEVT